MTIFEKIRAEIKKRYDDCEEDWENGEQYGYWNCLKILDKYADQEPTNEVSEIEENIIKYMKKYPNHVGNADFWEGFYACRNVVLQLDNEYLPKEQEPIREFTEEEAKAYSKALDKMYKPTGFNVFNEPCDDAVSREYLKKKLQENHDFFVNSYGGYKNMPQTDKARVDEITNCIAEVVNAPSVRPQEPCDDVVSRQAVLDIVNNPLNIRLDEIIKKLPSVRPQEPKESDEKK